MVSPGPTRRPPSRSITPGGDLVAGGHQSRGPDGQRRLKTPSSEDQPADSWVLVLVGSGLARCPSRPQPTARPDHLWRCAMSALLVRYARCSTDQQDLTAPRDGGLGLGHRGRADPRRPRSDCYQPRTTRATRGTRDMPSWRHPGGHQARPPGQIPTRRQGSAPASAATRTRAGRRDVMPHPARFVSRLVATCATDHLLDTAARCRQGPMVNVIDSNPGATVRSIVRMARTCGLAGPLPAGLLAFSVLVPAIELEVRVLAVSAPASTTSSTRMSSALTPPDRTHPVVRMASRTRGRCARSNVGQDRDLCRR